MRWLGRWFWTPVRENENSAQTIVRVLGNLLRSTFTLAALGVVGILTAIYISDLPHRAERQREEAAFDAIKVLVRHQTYSELSEEADRRQGEYNTAKLAGDEAKAKEIGKELFKLYSSEEGFDLVCSQDYPVGVYIANRSELVLERATIELVARTPGSSENRLSYPADTIEWTQYVLPGHALATCYASDQYSQFLNYTGTIRRYSSSLAEESKTIRDEAQSWPLK